MNSYLASLLTNIIGANIGDSTPQRNQWDNKQKMFVDKDGNPLPAEQQVPYKDPSFWTKALHPEVAQYMAGQNNNWAQMPAMATRQAQAGQAGEEETLTPTQSLFGGTPLSQRAGAIRGYGSEAGLNQAISDIATRNTGTIAPLANLKAFTGLNMGEVGLGQSQSLLKTQPTEANTRETEVATQNKAAKAALNRQDTIDESKDLQARNQLSTELNVEPEKIQSLIDEYRGVNKRNPQYQELQSALLAGHLHEAVVNAGLGAERERNLGTLTSTLGNQIAAAGNEAQRGKLISETELATTPLDQNALVNNKTIASYLSRFGPPASSPIGTRVNPDLSVTPAAVNPDYRNVPMAGVNALKSQVGGADLGRFQPPGGLPMVSNNRNPITGEPVSTESTVRQTPVVTPQPTGATREILGTPITNEPAGANRTYGDKQENTIRNIVEWLRKNAPIFQKENWNFPIGK